MKELAHMSQHERKKDVIHRENMRMIFRDMTLTRSLAIAAWRSSRGRFRVKEDHKRGVHMRWAEGSSHTR